VLRKVDEGAGEGMKVSVLGRKNRKVCTSSFAQEPRQHAVDDVKHMLVTGSIAPFTTKAAWCDGQARSAGRRARGQSSASSCLRVA
jgi:hypothetical protein